MTSSPRPFSFSPGPTEVHPIARDEMTRAAADGYLSESHRSAAVHREVERMEEALRTLLGIPPDHRVLVLGSATEAMERILQGTVRKRSFHLLNGAFARRFRDVAKNSGIDAKGIERPDGESFRAEDVPLEGFNGTELVALTQNETSTGARLAPADLASIAREARRAGILVAVDLVSGWPTEPVDVELLDATFFSVQKGFGLPPGLGILIASPDLVERARVLQASGHPVGGYMHLPALAAAADRKETVATPNTLGIRLLARVAERYLEEGGQAALARRAEAAFGAWWNGIRRIDEMSAAAGGPRLRPFVRDPDIRSRTVAVVSVYDSLDRHDGDPSPADHLGAELRERGLVVGNGYGPWKGKHLRVAHFPVQTEAMLARLRDELEGAVTRLARTRDRDG